MTYKIHRDGDTKTFEDKGKWKTMCDMLDQNDVEYTTTEPDTSTDGGEVEADVVDHTAPDPTPTAEPATDDIAALSQNPVEWLESINPEYVNTIKNTPTISKRGFRYIQSQFEISTESDVVHYFEDPVGVVVWARAELPDGRSAEAHGEGYRSERGLDDNEFVRYADTRAKSRALADLTSSGAIATEEMEAGSE